MSTFFLDLRFGLRQLAAKPGFATAAILTLALGIGANTAVFSVLSGYLLKPLPYPDGEQLVQVNEIDKLAAEPTPAVSLPLYQAIEQRSDAFTATAFYRPGNSNIAVSGRAKHVYSIYASASLFDVLGVQPVLGHSFTADNMHEGSNDVVVISYDLWLSSFGGDPDVIGKTVKLDDGVHRIIGVMPQGFTFPKRNYELWLPYVTTPEAFSPMRAYGLSVSFIGRLNPRLSHDGAEVRVKQAVATYIKNTVPGKLRKVMRDSGVTVGVQAYRGALFDMIGTRPTTFWLLQGAVFLILLITCVNVANLLLSRILGRSHEIAIRSTLGATRTMLARQLLSEALCLTVPGGLAGMALAWLGLHFLATSALSDGNSVFNVALDWRVGLFALGTILFTAALVSVLPIRHLAKTDLQMVLQEGSRTSGGGRGAKHTRNALVIVELTLATGLLAMAGLVLHSFMNLESVDPGFRKDHVLMASLLVPQNDHPNEKALSSFYTNLRQRVAALPGVHHIAMAQVLPLTGGVPNQRIFAIIGRQRPVSGNAPVAMINAVSQGYFETLDIPILQGRQFDAGDADRSAVIIDAGLARKYLHDAEPIGRQISFGGEGSKKYTIIGVVPSIKYATLSRPLSSVTVYFDGTVMPSRVTKLLIHTDGSPAALAKPLRNLVASIDPSVSVYDIHTMHEQLASSLRQRQTTMTLLLAFGGIALALAIVGVYAVMSYAVGQRRAECGVRLALGALPEDLSWLVLKDGLKLLAIGLVLGLGLAVLFGYLLSSQLFGVAPFDPVTLIGSAVALCAITLVACWLPARRAAKIDPAIAMMEQ